MPKRKKWNWYKTSLSSLLLITCAAVLLAAHIPCTYAAMSETELKERIIQYCMEQFGYTKDALEPYNFAHKDGGGWAFSLKIKDADPTTNGLVTGEMTEDGQLVSLEGPKSISISEQLREALLSSERSYEAMYWFKTEWGPRLAQLSDEDLADLNRDWFAKIWPFVSLLHHDIRLPAAQDISYEDAMETAREAILALAGWTREMLDCMAVRLAVYHVPAHGSDPVYQFVYSTASSVSQYDYHYGEQPISDTAYHKLIADEARMFGSTPPRFISVRINARTGALSGDIIIEAPPASEGAPYIYILWE